MFRILCILFLTISLSYAKVNLSTSITELNQVYLLPEQKNMAKDKILDLIQNAQNSITIAMYNFSYKKFAKALIKAKNRGVEIFILLDKKKALKNKISKDLEKKGIKIKLSKKKMHLKVAIFDNKTAVFGSSNWTKESFKNNIELIFITKDMDTIFKLDKFIKEI